MLQRIRIEAIDRANRLRPVDPRWAGTMAEALVAGDELPPIEVVETAPGRYRLIAGGHRVEAHVIAGREAIDAQVLDSAQYASEAAIRLREIRENFVRYELTALDRCIHLAEWKRCHEEIHGQNKGGRPRRGAVEKPAQNSAEVFAGSFSTTAAETLGISERSVQVAVKVASGLSPEARERLALSAFADTMSELIALAQEPAARQIRIVALLLSEPAQAGSVAEAIALLDRTPAPTRPAAWQKIADRFARLTADDRRAFFRVHLAEFRAFLAGEDASGEAD